MQGVNLSLTRDWGKYFGLTADGGYYAYTYDRSNPGNPTVDMVLLGPVLHFKLFEQVDGFVHVLLGGVHTAGDGTIPKVSFAGGAGGGLDYKLNARFAIRLSGDDIASSFVQDPNRPPDTRPICAGMRAPPSAWCTASEIHSRAWLTRNRSRIAAME